MANYKINKIYNDESPLVFRITKFPTGKSFATMQDIVFVVKKLDSDAYTERLVSKKLSDGEISTSGTRDVFVTFPISAYAGLEIGVTYRAGLFCKWTGDSDYDENVEQLYDLEITQDFHNE